MRFDHLRLTTQTLDPLVRFYAQDLEFSLVNHTEKSFTVAAGSTRLTFDADPSVSKTRYHFAIIVDAGIQATVAWLAERADVLRVGDDQSVRFGFLEADSVYFVDPAGNILEFICPFGATDRFTSSALRYVSEVGLPVKRPPVIADTLTERFGIPVWGDVSETFIRVGDVDGRFLVTRLGRDWFPTEASAVAAPLNVTIASTRYAEWTHPDLPYHVETTARSTD